MSLFADAIQRGTRASQPAASAVVIGTLYFVTDEGVTERSTGSAWENFTDGITGSSTSNVDIQFVEGSDTGEHISDAIMVGSTLTLTELGDSSGDAIKLDVDTSTFVLQSDTNFVDLTDSGETTLHTHPAAFTDQSLEEASANGTHDWERTLEQPLLYRVVILPQSVTTMSGDVTLSTDSATYQFFDPADSARNVDTPTEFAGMNYVIWNIGDGGETITIRDSADATITTCTNGQVATIIYAGGAWRSKVG